MMCFLPPERRSQQAHRTECVYVCGCVCRCTYVSAMVRLFQCKSVIASETACGWWKFLNKRNFFWGQCSCTCELCIAPDSLIWGLNILHSQRKHPSSHSIASKRKASRQRHDLMSVSKTVRACVCWVLNWARARLDADYQPRHLCGCEGGECSKRCFYFSMREWEFELIGS